MRPVCEGLVHTPPRYGGIVWDPSASLLHVEQACYDGSMNDCKLSGFRAFLGLFE